MLGFAFYVQPMLMPLLHELPPGPASVSLTATAVRIVVIGVASVVQLHLACASSSDALFGFYDLQQLVAQEAGFHAEFWCCDLLLGTDQHKSL